MKISQPDFAVLFTKTQEALQDEQQGFELKQVLDETARIKELEEYLEAATDDYVTTYSRA